MEKKCETIQKKKLIQFCDIVPTDVDGKPTPIPNLHKTIANIIHARTQSCDMLDIAMEINRGKAVELTPAQGVEILSCLNDPKAGMYARIRIAVEQFLEEQLPSKE